MITKKQTKHLQKLLAQDDGRLPLIFSALSDRCRYRIFKLLMDYRNLCVSDVANICRISVPAASQQLKILEMSGLTKKERKGQMTCYGIRKENPVIRSLVRFIADKQLELQRSAV